MFLNDFEKKVRFFNFPCFRDDPYIGRKFLGRIKKILRYLRKRCEKN